MGRKDNNYVTAKDVADHFRVSAKTVMRRAKQGMPHYVLGNRSVRFKLDEVLEWSRNQKKGGRRTKGETLCGK